MKSKHVLLTILLILAITVVLLVSFRTVTVSKAVASRSKLYELKGSKNNVISLTDILIAEQNGYFAEAGIKFKDMGTIKPQDSLPAMVRGDIDFMLMHPDRLAQARLAGIKVIAISTGMIDDPKYPHLIYFVKEESPIRSAKDLIGKKIGVSFRNSCPDGILLDWLYQNGISKDKVEFVIINETELEQALKQGLIDVIGSHPTTYQAIKNHGGVRILVDSYQIVKNPNAGTSFSVVVTEKWAKAHPDIAKGVVGSVIKAHDFIDNHRAEAVKIAAAAIKIPEKDVTAFYYDEQKLITDERIQPWFDRLVRFGDLKPGQIKPSEIYTNIYNPYYKGN